MAGRGRFAWDMLMVVLALVSVAYVLYGEVRPYDEATFETIARIDLLVIALFLGDFLYGLKRAPDRRAFVRENWYDLPGLVPMYAETLSVLRGFRLLRIFRVLRLLRIVRAHKRIQKTMGWDLFETIRRSRVGYTGLVAVTVVVILSGAAWVVERDVNPQFATFSLALWWGIVTAATVGYGDIVPATTEGRVIGVALMIMGIGLIATLASTIGAALVSQEREENPSGGAPSLAGEIERLAALRDRGALTEDEFSRAKDRLFRK
ncbi:MAG: ion transporter [Methanobacteriota archaeon]